MTAPVAPGSSVRASLSSGTAGDSNQGAPFAAALDGALNAGRDSATHAATRRSPQSEQPPGGGERRAGVHDREDGRRLRQAPAAPSTQGSRRTDAGAPARTASTPRPADEEAERSADDPATDPADAVDPGAAALLATIPQAWILPTASAAPETVVAAGTDARADPLAGVAAAAGTSTQGAAGVDASLSAAALAVPGVQPGSADGDAVPATPPAGAPVALPAQAAAGMPEDVGAAGASGPATRAALSAAAGIVASQAAGARPPAVQVAAAALSAAPAASDDGDPAAPPVVDIPSAPALAATAPAWARTAAATAAPTAPTAPSPDPAVPGDGGAALPDIATVVAVSSQGAEDSPSSDSGDTSRQNPGVVAADPSAAFVAPPLAAAPAVAPVQASAPAAVPHQPVSTQVATQVAVLSNGPDGTHSVTVVLHPDSLGPVHVQVTLTQGTVDLTMRGAHEQGRAALMDALPDLRRDLQSAGLTCSSLDVDQDTGGSWASSQQGAQQQWAEQGRRPPEWSDGRFRPWSPAADSGDSAQIPASTRSTSRGVDVRV